MCNNISSSCIPYCKQLILSLFCVLLIGLFDYGETINRNSHQNCIIKLPNDIPIDEPLYLKMNNGKFNFIKFINETNSFSINTRLKLLCHGRRNHIAKKSFDTNSTEIVCKSKNQFTEIGNLYSNIDLKSINCTKTITTDLYQTQQKCSYNNHGYLYEIGYRINSKDFLTIFKVCYSNLTYTTFFSVHEIIGAAIKYAVKDNRRRSFISAGISNRIDINQVYKKQNQIAHFNQVLGFNQPYFNSTMYLARGHLTPDADFILPNFQLATYYYVNVAPEFQIINAGNWLRIENIVRALAADYGDDFLIYTGVYDILKLKNSNSNLYVPLFLDNQQKIGIPKWFWKVIKNLKKNAGVVFITLNNPFAEKSEIYELCPNVCERASIKSKHFQDIRKGYTFCCEIDAFKKIVNDLPSNFTVKSLLNCGKVSNLIDSKNYTV